MEKEEKAKKIGELYQEVHDKNDELFNIWQEHTLFHWDWWLSVILIIIPRSVFFIYREKGSTARFMVLYWRCISNYSLLHYMGFFCFTYLCCDAHSG